MRGVHSHDGECNKCCDVLRRAVWFMMTEQQTFLSSAIQPQQAANEGATLLQKYLHRWSAYADIVQDNNRAGRDKARV